MRLSRCLVFVLPHLLMTASTQEMPRDSRITPYASPGWPTEGTCVDAK
jgi:hypothetical protein